MATGPPGRGEPGAAVAILAKAPLPGFAKTRLIPTLGPDGAAALQARLIQHTLATARAAAIGPVILWCAPSPDHPAFAAAARAGATLAAQPRGDLGRRMLAAFEANRPGGPVLLLGTDCPVITPGALRDALDRLRDGADAVIAPAEDGGYGLVGAIRPIPELFRAVPWGTDRVAAATRERARAAGLRLAELPPVWDVDHPADYERLVRAGLLAGFTAPGPS